MSQQNTEEAITLLKNLADRVTEADKLYIPLTSYVAFSTKITLYYRYKSKPVSTYKLLPSILKSAYDLLSIVDASLVIDLSPKALDTAFTYMDLVKTENKISSLISFIFRLIYGNNNLYTKTKLYKHHLSKLESLTYSTYYKALCPSLGIEVVSCIKTDIIKQVYVILNNLYYDFNIDDEYYLNVCRTYLA